jgi:hypothetical protein
VGTPNHPCIVIPGIKGTGLQNIYALPPTTTWSTWEGAEQGLGDPHIQNLLLSASGELDLSETVVNEPLQLLRIAYQSFVQGLRGRSKLPVYLFPYDWRYSSARSAKLLVDFVRLLQQKTLTSGAGSRWDRSFDFACHSMGGLVFRQFLAAWQAAFPDTALPVNRVVFIATPHLGSLDAVEAMIRGETSLFQGRKELRKLARTCPGVYELLPNPRLPNTVLKDGTPLDIFDVHNWQATVTPDQNDPNDQNVEQTRLDAAKEFIVNLPDATDAKYRLSGRIFVIYGNKRGSTLRTVTVLGQQNDTKNWYDFDHAGKGDGDEVVPIESATLPGVPAFEIHAGDVSVFNLKSHILSLHALLPSLDEVASATSRFFSGSTGPDLLPRGTDPASFQKAAVGPLAGGPPQEAAGRANVGRSVSGFLGFIGGVLIGSILGRGRNPRTGNPQAPTSES